MNEKTTEPLLDAHRGGTGSSATSRVSMENATQINEGAVGKIHQILLKVHNVFKGKEKTRALEMVYKQMKDEGWQNIDLDLLLTKYGFLKKIKSDIIKIPDTFRKIQKGQKGEEGFEEGIVMTDLSERGKNLVVSSNEMSYEAPEHREEFLRKLVEENPEHARRLRDIDLNALNENLDQLSAEAINNNFFIYVDVPFLVLKPDGSFDIVLADFENMVINTTFPQDKLEHFLGENMTSFKTMVRESKEYLQQIFPE
jgi:hypothetical protein